jgi:RHS repeat-associated protein
MRVRPLFTVVFLCVSFASIASAQAPLCDVTCAPNPTSPSYSGTFAARPVPQNVRGQGTPLAARAAGGHNLAPTIAGSQSASHAIPILHLPGRNGLDLDLTLYYSSRVWTIDQVNNTATFNADKDFPTYGFRLNYGYLEGPTGSTYVWTEPDGTKHQLNSSGDSQDSSYVHYDAGSKTLRTKNGTAWVFEQVGTTTTYRPIKIEDTSGNFISIVYNTASGANNQSIASITDTLGRQVIFNYDANYKLLNITAPGFGGAGQTTVATFTWSTATLKYSFSSPLSVKDTSANNSSINVITQCRYANSAGYNFIYGDWGVVKEIDQVSATGTLRNSVSWNFPLGTTAQTDSPAFSQQAVFDGVNTGTWTFSVTKTSGLVSSVAVTDPAGTVTTTNLITSGSQAGLVSSQTVGTSTTTLRTAITTWIQDGTSSPAVNPRVSQVTTKLNDRGQISWVSYSYTTSYGDVSQVQETDFGGVLTRTTQTDFLTGSAYLAASVHILDRPIQSRVYKGSATSGNLVARTDYAYDATGSLTGVNGAQQHDDTNYGSAFTTRGNLTSVTRYPNLPSTSPTIVRSFTYDTLGNLLTAQVDCCNQEQWTFNSTTQYAYATTITRGPTGTQLSTSRAYDFNTGLLTSATDENNQITSFAYDSVKRMTTVTRPDSVQLTTSFDDNAAFPSVTSTTPVDTGKSVVQITTTDGLGRPTKQETKDAGSVSYSIVDTQYDALGRVTQVSNPHTSGQTAVWTANNFDTLSRVTKVIPPDGTSGSNNTQFAYSGNNTVVTDPAGKQRRTFSDALGRLVQVHEPGYDDGSYGAGSVTLSGGVQFKMVTNPNPPPAHIPFYDSGTVFITVGTYTASYAYQCVVGDSCDSVTSVASGLATTFNTDVNSPVTATVSGAGANVINLVSRLPGPQGNYLVSTSSQWDTADFTNPSFTFSPAQTTMTGGTDGSGGDGNPPTLATPLVTVYNYDVLDNLTAVFQGQQSRAYVYDSLGRLKTATTPESGAVNYAYNDSGTTASRTDARGVITNYAYDGLNRLYQLTYTTTGTTAVATPSVTFAYGTSPASYNNGRLLSMSDGLGGEAYAYDRLGRMISLTKTIGATNYPMAYAYNLANEPSSITYPSGRVVAQSFDNIGRLSQITSSSVNYLTVAASTGYNAANEVLSATYGNGVAATFTYNTRLQLASLAYAKSGANLFSLAYNYGTGNNGQIQSITDNVDNGRTVNYTYDAWSRLKTAATAGSTAYPAWGLSWSYDRYGNRKQQTVTAGSNMPSNSVTPSPTTNRITDSGYAYDLAGNMTGDGSNTLTYDAENRVTNSVNGGASGSYAFDGNSLRVQKTVAGATTLYIFSGAKVIAEYASGAAPSSPSKEYLYAGSQLLATLTGPPASATVNYHIADHLSPRVTTDSTGTVVGQQDHFPFGEDWYASSTTTKFKFTSYERDSESGNDYAMMRTSVNRLGRFSSPDPIAGSIADPQSLNRYAYALNEATNLADPAGLRPAPLENSGDGWLLGGGGGSCYIDGFSADCGMANAMLAGDFGVKLRPGVSLSGFINGQYYYLTADSDEDGDYIDYNYFGLSAAQIETLGLPTDFYIGSISDPGSLSKDQIIQRARKALLNALLGDTNCINFLAGRNADVLNVLKNIPITPGDLGYYRFAAETFNDELSPNGKAPANPYIQINNQGFFFTYPNSIGFQGSILLHELGHATGVLVPDGVSNNPALTAQLQAHNAEAINTNCAKALKNLGKP